MDGEERKLSVFRLTGNLGNFALKISVDFTDCQGTYEQGNYDKKISKHGTTFPWYFIMAADPVRNIWYFPTQIHRKSSIVILDLF